MLSLSPITQSLSGNFSLDQGVLPLLIRSQTWEVASRYLSCVPCLLSLLSQYLQQLIKGTVANV